MGKELQLFFSLQQDKSNKKILPIFFKKDVFRERDLKVNYKKKKIESGNRWHVEIQEAFFRFTSHGKGIG